MDEGFKLSLGATIITVILPVFLNAVFCGENDEKTSYFEYCAKHIATISEKYEGLKKNICWIERLLPHCNFPDKEP